MAQTILITGATSGIGQETARELALRGARVIVAGRSEEKAAETVAANAMHPGFVSTGMGSNNVPRWFGRIFQGFTGLFARDVAQGAETIIYLADSPQVAGVSGKYFMDKKPIASSPLSYDEALARQLWERSADLVGLSETL